MEPTDIIVYAWQRYNRLMEPVAKPKAVAGKPRQKRRGAWGSFRRAIAVARRAASRLLGREPEEDPHAYVTARRTPNPRGPRSASAVLDLPD